MTNNRPQGLFRGGWGLPRKPRALVGGEEPALIVLDMVLRDNTDGYAVARRVREFSDVPILMLTAKSREADLLRGFEVGADDYLTKPFSSRELVARARSLLKRSPHAHRTAD